MDLNGRVRSIVGKDGFCNIRFQGQVYDDDIQLCYNRFRWYDDLDGRYIAKDPIGLLSGEYGFYNYVGDSNGWIDVFGLEMIPVGRWMSQVELDQMLSTNKVIESVTGTTHVASPANIDAFGKQAKNGTKYVEFDVPKSTLVPTNDGWAKIIGPNSLEGRLAKKKGIPVPELPKVENINVKAEKIDGKIKKISCG
ncbi:RHS repeat domain-containing protein [Tenacibaculum maritimum]|uniref:RHS repeat domain-containing protein n=2 Tax=Tenacibaculum maritimum TaxID=107401 RepID=UPI0012FFEBFC|nr:RHS repeat-associated core domain-containing protein [Tenacibaculum maritimum]